MIEVFFEETVTPKDSALANKRFKRTQLLSRMFLFSAIIFTLFLFMTFFVDSSILEEMSLVTYFLFNILPVLVICAIFYGIYIYLRLKKHKYLVDYDYTFVSGELRIAKVLNGIKRKLVAKIDCKDIFAMGKKSSNGFLRYKTMPDIKILTATPNELSQDADETIYFMGCTYNGQKTLIIFEPSNNLLYNIKRFAGGRVEYV